MCCVFCEEPVRSITVGLAAVGVVYLINSARTLLKPQRPGASLAPQRAEADASESFEAETAS